MLYGLFLFHWVRGHLETARINADEMLRIAEQADDPALLLMAHFSMGGALWHIGDNRAALNHLLQAHARYDEKAHAPLALVYGQDFGVWTLSYLEHAQLSLGYPDKGARAIEQALALARRLNHALSLCNALIFKALSSIHRRDPASARKFTEEVRKIAGEHGFPQYLALAAFDGGWALAQLGSAQEGIEEGQQGIAAWHALGAAVALPGILATLAESQLAACQARAALDTADEALSWIGKNGEHAYDSYLYCCRGDIFRMLSEPDQARRQYQAAINVARDRRASSGSFTLPSNLHACGATRASASKHAIFLRQSTAGSPKASTRRF